MAKYTIELNTLLKDEKFNVFDFDYDFYSEEAKPNFEQLFKDYYRFHEIGFETVERFQHNLKSRLNLIMPYYTQLYETEVKAKDINFLLNKDLKETFIRELTGNENENLSSESSTSSTNSSTNNFTGTNNNSSSTNALSESLSKESYLDNGNADVNLNEGNLTGVNGSNSTGTTSSTSETTDTNITTISDESSNSNTLSSNKTNENKMSEKTELISQGNIGITSSAELLEKWRKTIININQLIISECEDLFMQIY